MYDITDEMRRIRIKGKHDVSVRLKKTEVMPETKGINNEIICRMSGIKLCEVVVEMLWSRGVVINYGYLLIISNNL